MTSTLVAAHPASAAVRLEVGALTDRTLAAVLTAVAAHPPFVGYAFGLMVHNLTNQLRHGANVMLIHEGRLAAYAGWLRVLRTEAADWHRGLRSIPEACWSDGDAAIVTVVVADLPTLLTPLIRAVSHVCADLPVYRMRSFQDGRPDIRRPPIVGRRHVWQ